jgi:hypothetical protein
MRKLTDLQSCEYACGVLGTKTGLAAIGSRNETSVSIFPTSEPGKFTRIGLLEDLPSGVETLCWDPQGEQNLVTGCEGGSVWLWDVAMQSQISTFSGHRSICSASAYHPFGNFFATGSGDTNIKVWDARTGKCIQTYRSHSSMVTSIKFSPHGRWLASGDEDGVIRVFDLSTGKELCVLESHTNSVSCIDFHPTDFFFISSARDKTIKLWSCEGGFSLAASSETETLPMKMVRFNPTGKSLMVASDEYLKKFELNNESKRIACISSEFVPWKSVLDGIFGDLDDQVTVLAHNGDMVSVWSSNAISLKKTEDTVLVPKENRRIVNREPVPVVTPEAAHPTRGIANVLSDRVLSSRTVSSMWTSGKTRAAVEEAIGLEDPTVFISLMAGISTERSRNPIAVDTCIAILEYVLDCQYLTFPETVSTAIQKRWMTLPFSKSPFEKGNASDFSAPLGAIIAGLLAITRRSASLFKSSGENVDMRNKDCLELFHRTLEVLRSEIRQTKLLRKEKDQLLTEISALIQSR